MNRIFDWFTSIHGYPRSHQSELKHSELAEAGTMLIVTLLLDEAKAYSLADSELIIAWEQYLIFVECIFNNTMYETYPKTVQRR